MKFIFPGILLLLLLFFFIVEPLKVLAVIGLLVGMIIYEDKSISTESKRNWGIGIAIIIGLYLLQEFS